MALQRRGAALPFGTSSVTTSGISEVTEFEASTEFGNVTEGRGSNGDISAFLFGAQKNSMSITGYGDTVPALNSAMSVKGVTGFSTKATVRGNNEDFVKLQIEGVGAPGVT